MAQNDVLEEFLSSINNEPLPSQQYNTEEQSAVYNYLNPTIQEEERPRTSLETYQPRNIEDRSLGFQVFQGNYTLDDLERNEEFQLRAERFMESIKADEDIFEYLRDTDFSLSSAIVRAGQVKGWSEQTKEDYNYLRQVFDQADLGSTKQFMQLAKDLTVDLIADPLNWLAAVFFVPSGGLSGATGIAAKEAAKMGFKQIAKEGLKGAKKPAMYGAVEGAAWTGPHDYFLQNAEVELGMRDEINWGQTALSTGLGAGLGTAFGGAIGLGVTGGSLLRKKLSHYSDDVGIDKEVDNLSRQAEMDDYADKKAVELIDDEAKATPKGKDPKKKKKKKTKEEKETVKKIKKRLTVLANTFGKPVAEFVEIAQNSQTLQQLLGHFRSDWSKTLAKGIDKQMLSTFGEELNTRMFGYLTELRATVGSLNRTNVDWSSWDGFKKTFKNSLDQQQNDHLTYLLRLNQDEFDNIIQLDKYYKGVRRISQEELDAMPPRERIRAEKQIREDAAELAKRSTIDKDIEITYSGEYKTIKQTNDIGETISPEVIEAAARSRDILRRIFNEASGAENTKVFDGIGDINLNLMASEQRIPNYFPRHFNFTKIMDDRGKAGEGGFEDLIYRHDTHSDPMLDIKDADKIEVIDPETGKVVINPETGKAQLYFPKGTKSVDETVFGTANYNKLKSLVEKGERAAKKGEIPVSQINDEARKFKAKLIVDGMLERRNQPFSFGHRETTTAGSSYLQHRVFSTIDDRLLEPYIENSFEDVMEKYIMKSSRDITRTAFFGRDELAFRAKFIDPIKDELKASKVDQVEINKVTEKLKKMYMRVTGLDAHELNPEGWRRTALDWTRLSQQAAHLPLATLSSITEPMIMLSRMDTIDGKMSASGQVGKAIVRGVKKDIAKFNQFVQRASGKKVKGFADMQDEYWQEAYKVGLAIEQGVMAHFEGLYGEAAKGGGARFLQNAFFKANLLTSWTGAVQLASFTTGKRLIRENAERLHLHNEGITKLSKEKEQVLKEQLWDLGINEREATTWYRNSLDDNGIFDESRARGARQFRTKEEKRKGTWNSSIQREQFRFYENSLTKGANRFTREIILNPSTSEANRPLWFSHPAGQLLAQFAGYPTVFNNTILKRWSYETAEDVRRAGRGELPQATGRILGTAASMTTIAVFMNAVRSGGRSLEEQDETIILEAVQRWGGLGPADVLYRMQQNTIHGSGPAGTIAKSLPGPIVSDVVDAIAYRKGIPEILATNTPFYSALPKDIRDSYKKSARELNKQLTRGMFEETKSSPYISPSAFYAKGGVVNIPNASREPDEKKVRGLPFTYAELGGVLAQDVEDRRGFVFGGLVNRILRAGQRGLKITDTDTDLDDELVQYLTKDFRKAEPIFESNATTSLYKQQEADEFANIEGEAIRYIDSDKLHDLESELRYSNAVGVEVSTKPKKSGGKKLKQKGRLRLVRPLDLTEGRYSLREPYNPLTLSDNISALVRDRPENLRFSDDSVNWDQVADLVNNREFEGTSELLKRKLIQESPLPNEDATKRIQEFAEDFSNANKFLWNKDDTILNKHTGVLENLFEARQSFKLRELLTDLGFDSIKTKDAYILFDNNQFRVTKKQTYRGFKDLEEQVDFESSPLGLYSKSFAALENLPDKLFQGKNKTVRGQDLEKHLLGRGLKKPQIQEMLFALKGKNQDNYQQGLITKGELIEANKKLTFTREELIEADREILEAFDNLEIKVTKTELDSSIMDEEVFELYGADPYSKFTGRNADPKSFVKQALPPISLHFSDDNAWRRGHTAQFSYPNEDTHFDPRTLSWTRASRYGNLDKDEKSKVLIEELQAEIGGQSLKEPYNSNWDRYALLARFRETAKDSDIGEIILTTPAHLETADMQLNKNAMEQWYDPQKGRYVAAMKDIAKEFGGEVKYKKYPFMQSKKQGELLLSENSVNAINQMYKEDLPNAIDNILEKNNIDKLQYYDYADNPNYDNFNFPKDPGYMNDILNIDHGFGDLLNEFRIRGEENTPFTTLFVNEMREDVPYLTSIAQSLEEGRDIGTPLIDMIEEWGEILDQIFEDALSKDPRPAAYIELTDEFRKNLLELPARLFKYKGGVVRQMNRLGLTRGGEVETLTDEEYDQLFNIVKSKETPKEEKQSAWKAIIAGMRASGGAISEGISKVFSDGDGLTDEQIEFLIKSRRQ